MPIKFTRKHNRLPHKILYLGNNWYFVTICVQDRVCIFVEETPTFPFAKNIIQNEWLNIAKFYSNVVLDQFVIMPNHFHGIIGFYGAPFANINQKNTDLSKIISTFKTITTKKIKELISTNDNENLANVGVNGNVGVSSTKYLIQKYNTIWQKSFYDHVIRGEKDLQRIQEYVLNNPLQWELDILNPKNNDRYQMWLIAKNTKLKLE